MGYFFLEQLPAGSCGIGTYGAYAEIIYTWKSVFSSDLEFWGPWKTLSKEEPRWHSEQAKLCPVSLIHIPWMAEEVL